MNIHNLDSETQKLKEKVDQLEKRRDEIVAEVHGGDNTNEKEYVSICDELDKIYKENPEIFIAPPLQR